MPCNHQTAVCTFAQQQRAVVLSRRLHARHPKVPQPGVNLVPQLPAGQPQHAVVSYMCSCAEHMHEAECLLQ